MTGVLRRDGAAASLLLASYGWLALAAASLSWLAPARPVAVFAFTLTGPGAALVRLLPVRELLERVTLAVALSLSLATLVAEAAYIGHRLRPLEMLAGLAALCTVAALAPLARGAKPACLILFRSCFITP